MTFNDTAWENFRSMLITGFVECFSIRGEHRTGLFVRTRLRRDRQ
jgi:hypothetical protein